MKQGLTILIPTYNRKNRLTNMLHSIAKQGHWDEYTLLIVDNNSPDYKWDEILSDFPKGFIERIQIEKRIFNCGMSCNISSCFLLVNTQWLLLLSDDDEMVEGGIEIILKDMKKYAQYGAVKYTLYNAVKHKDTEITDINQYNEYFNRYESGGDAIFITMLYNLEVLNRYLPLVTSYAYTYISFLLPIYASLIDHTAKLKLSPDSIIRYIIPEKNTGWNFIKILLGISTLQDIQLKLNKKQNRDLLRTILRNFPMLTILKYLFNENHTKSFTKYCIYKYYYSLYRPAYGSKAVILLLIYNLKYVLNIDLFKWKNSFRKIFHGDC